MACELCLCCGTCRRADAIPVAEAIMPQRPSHPCGRPLEAQRLESRPGFGNQLPHNALVGYRLIHHPHADQLGRDFGQLQPHNKPREGPAGTGSEVDAQPLRRANPRALLCELERCVHIAERACDAAAAHGDGVGALSAEAIREPRPGHRGGNATVTADEGHPLGKAGEGEDVEAHMVAERLRRLYELGAQANARGVDGGADAVVGADGAGGPHGAGAMGLGLCEEPLELAGLVAAIDGSCRAIVLEPEAAAVAQHQLTERGGEVRERQMRHGGPHGAQPLEQRPAVCGEDRCSGGWRGVNHGRVASRMGVGAPERGERRVGRRRWFERPDFASAEVGNKWGGVRNLPSERLCSSSREIGSIFLG